MDNSTNNSRIAKNTGMLYIRMLLIMAVALYTSRVVLNVLGVEDFGIYNVVGGFVAMVGFLKNSMAVATQRFLSFEIGNHDFAQLKRVFSMSMTIHFIIAFIILILAETIGLWFVNTQLTIPPERMEAARWVYHFSVLAFIVNVISVPYDAIIIANERMNVFAYISVLEVSLKLLLVFVLQWFAYDKLKFYAVLMFSVALIIRIFYGIYCSRNFSETKYHFFWDSKLLKTILSFSGWSLWGSAASVLQSQGVNILLNIFFGPVVNAARGIGYQVQGAVNGFVSNFQIAMKPQIIKSFASGDLKYMHQLIIQGAKFSYFLLFTLSLPILLETEIILRLWLKIVPEYTVIFTQLIIINILIDSISGPLMTAAQASGKIKLYQSVVGGLLILNLPISYFFLKFGFNPEVTLLISIFLSIIALFARLMIVQKLVELKMGNFILKVVARILIVTILSLIIPMILQFFLIEESILKFLVVGLMSVLSAAFCIVLIGLNNVERLYLKKIIIRRMLKQ